jgi:hypothetical protein
VQQGLLDQQDQQDQQDQLDQLDQKVTSPYLQLRHLAQLKVTSGMTLLMVLGTSSLTISGQSQMETLQALLEQRDQLVLHPQLQVQQAQQVQLDPLDQQDQLGLKETLRYPLRLQALQ